MATKKKAKESKRKYLNIVNLSLYVFEAKKFKNCTVLKTCLNNGKDEDGEYLKSTPIDVLITKNTEVDSDLDIDEGEIGETYNVNGSIKVEYNEYKKKEYTNIKIFATDIYPLEESDD